MKAETFTPAERDQLNRAEALALHRWAHEDGDDRPHDTVVDDATLTIIADMRERAAAEAESEEVAERIRALPLVRQEFTTTEEMPNA